MTTFTLHTPESAPAGSKENLQAGLDRFGFVPNLYAHLAESPTSLGAYFDISARFEKTSFSPTERQVILLTASVENGCGFCVAVHSMIARKMLKVADAVVDALRAGKPIDDTRLQALSTFTRTMVIERGWVVGAPLDAFLAAGFNQQQALEVVLGVTMKTLSNYTNHLAQTPTNAEFADEAWTRPA